jgi:hypothetical protein
VVLGIVELAKRGLHGGVLIKKRRYWPKWILGKEIKAHFAEKEVGLVDCWNGNLNGQAVTVFCFKEPEYVMSIMSAYGTVNEEGVIKNGFSLTPTERSKFARFATQRSSTTTTNIGIWLTTTINNNNRMQPISIEETWKTSYWPNRVFAFILGVTGVNMQRAFEHFAGNAKQGNLEFRRELATEMIHNPDVPVKEDDHQSKERRCKKQKQVHRESQTLPRKCTFDAHEPTKLVATKIEYNQRKCVCGLARKRIYCKCTPGVRRCPECYADHRIGVVMANSRSELNSVTAL